MTDAEIIKALECCKAPVGSGSCNNCPFDFQRQKRLTPSDKKSCTTMLFDSVIDLINRQQAEIEKMKQDLTIDLEGFASEYDEKIKSEAVKEFAEQLEAEIISSDKYIREYDGSEVQKAYNKGLRDALKILKEMGCE